MSGSTYWYPPAIMASRALQARHWGVLAGYAQEAVAVMLALATVCAALQP